MDFLNVATFGTSSSSTKVLVLDGNTVKSRTASQVVTDGGGSSSSKYRADFSVIPYSGYAGGITSASNASAFPDSADYVVYRTEFNPTNFTLGLWCVNASGNNAGNVGFDLQYTVSDPPTSGWTSVSGSTLNANGSSSAFKYVSSTVSVTSFSTAAFWRIRWVNSTGSDATFSVKNFYFSLWN